jgi:starch synthase
MGRYKVGLPSNRVTTHPLPELAYIGSTRLGVSRSRIGKILEWRNEQFDNFAAKLAARIEPEAVACYDSCALKSFQRAEKLGALRVLDQVIGHIKSGLSILREEAELSPEFADGEDISPPDRLIDRCAQEALLADVVLAGSEYVKGTLVAQGVSTSRIVVVPYGVDTARFVPRTQEESCPQRLRLLFAGHIGLRKGVRYLLDAVRELNTSRVDLTLLGLVEGSGRGLVRYRDYLTHRSHVPHSEMLRMFQQADVFVLPSLHEGSAYSTYEALACGLPVITTANSGSVVRDGIDGFIVPVRDVEALKEKILLLLCDRELREQMSRNARMRAEAFTWDAYHQRIAHLFGKNVGFAAPVFTAKV